MRTTLFASMATSVATFAFLSCSGPCSAQSDRSNGANAPQSLTEPGGVDSRLHGAGTGSADKDSAGKKDKSAEDDAAERADAAKRDEMTRDDPPAGRTAPPKPIDSEKHDNATKTSEPSRNEPTKPTDAPKDADDAKPTKTLQSDSQTFDNTKKDGARDTGPARPERGRVGTLSPDEERRAARARERAEAARKSAPTAAGGHRDASPSVATEKMSVEPKSPETADVDYSSSPGIGPTKSQTAPRERAARPREIDRRQTVTRTDRRNRASAYSAPPRGAADDDPMRRPRAGDVVPQGVPLYPVPPGYEAPRRRALANDPRRAPRVGDVLPPGVPLYPVPPGYGGY